MTNGYEMSNGMKVNFEGTVTPAKYATGSWYVEGVGDEIKLIAEQDVMIPGTYSTSRANPFDSEGFDRSPFSTASAYADAHDYIVQNRSATSRSPYSRYNKWFPQSVLENIATILDEPSRHNPNR